MTDKPVIEAEYDDERWLEAVSGKSRSTWQKRRMSGRDGPPFVKLGHAVIYHKATTLAWIAARAQTREPKAAYPVTPQTKPVGRAGKCPSAMATGTRASHEPDMERDRPRPLKVTNRRRST